MDLLGYEVLPNHTDSIAIGDPGAEGPSLLFVWSGTKKAGKNRVHLDVRPEDQQVALRRAELLGARRIDAGQGDTSSFVVLADPEGNEFGLLRSRPAYARFRQEHGPGSVSLVRSPERCPSRLCPGAGGRRLVFGGAAGGGRGARLSGARPQRLGRGLNPRWRGGGEALAAMVEALCPAVRTAYDAAVPATPTRSPA